MVLVWSLTVLLTTTVQCLPLSSSSEGPSLVFTAGTPGFAYLEEIPASGSLRVSLSFKTGASEGQLLYMREVSSGHYISLSLSGGALHLKVSPDTKIISVEDKFNDNQWHNVSIQLVAGLRKIILIQIDDTPLPPSFPKSLPLLQNTKYETFIGGLSPSLSDESEGPYAGCIRNIQVLQTDRDLQNIQRTGATVGECALTTQDYIPVFEGSLLGVITETDQVGSVIMNIQAVTGDRNSQIMYELLENPQNYFSLDKTTGALTIAKELDRVALRDTKNLLILTVRASTVIGKRFSIDFFCIIDSNVIIIFENLDQRQSSNSSTAEVTIILKDAYAGTR